MKTNWIVAAAVLCAVTVAACDKSPPKAGVPPQQSSAPPLEPSASPPATMSQVPATAAERKASTPVQGQVDPGQPAQRKDFESTKR